MSERDPETESNETTDAAESSKSYGEHVKDAAHDLKEDVKDVGRRGDDDEEDEEESSGRTE
jgi:hypothetical protein